MRGSSTVETGMKVFLAFVSAAAFAGAGAVFTGEAKAAFFPVSGPEAPALVAPVVCKWVKENPSCWGDTCRMKKVCGSPTGSYRPGMPMNVGGRGAGKPAG